MKILIHAIDTVWRWTLALIVAALLVVVVSQVLDRRFIDMWSDSPEEYVKIGLIWLTFIGFALAMREGTEIRVDLADHFLPRKARAILYGMFDAVLLVLIGIVVWKSYVVWKVSLDQVILGTDFSVATPVAGMLIGLSLMFVAVLARLIRRFLPQPEVDEHRPVQNY